MIGMIVNMLLKDLNVRLLDPDGYQQYADSTFGSLGNDILVLIFFPLVLILIVITGILWCTIIGERFYRYNQIKKQIRSGIKDKIKKIDDHILTQQIDMDYPKVLLIYVKLNKALRDAKDLPTIPIARKKTILLAFSVLSTLYSIISFIIEQLGLFFPA